MTVRLLTGAELPDLVPPLVAVERASAALFTGMRFPPDDPAQVLRQATAVLVAGQPPVGFAALGVLDGDAHLEQLSVHPEHGRRGIGTRLLAAAVEHAAAAGHRRLVLTTFRDIAWNGPWYARNGFRALSDVDCPAELRAVRAAEVRAGLDALAPRTAMVRELHGSCR